MMRRLGSRLIFWAATLGGAAWLCRAEFGLEAQTLAPDAHLGGVAAAPPARRLLDAIVRDPFAGAPDDAPAARPASSWESDAGAAGDRVPNIDTAAGTAAPATQLTVRAAIVGSNPVAYVDDGSGMQIVRIGDIVGGRNVSAIDLQGVVFADGTRLNLPAAPPLAVPLPPVGHVTRSRAARAAARHLPPPRSSTPSPAAVASPSPAPELLYATPAPLRTVDARGLAPGVNPTPDLFDPTPFSYPYPYPPPH